jgi:hypothetical protein
VGGWIVVFMVAGGLRGVSGGFFYYSTFVAFVGSISVCTGREVVGMAPRR